MDLLFSISKNSSFTRIKYESPQNLFLSILSSHFQQFLSYRSSKNVNNRLQSKPFDLLSSVDKNSQIQTDSSDSPESLPENSIGKNLKRQRKNKKQTKKEIQKKHKDQGQGGKCIASNMTKSFIRVIRAKLGSLSFEKFKKLIADYNIKSQKENAIIIFLILYDFVKTQTISFETFEGIFSCFVKSLIQSKDNCQKKIKKQTERRGFHNKNRKMYLNFIKLNADLFDTLKKTLKGGQVVKLKFSQISNKITDTYDRKQRQIEKAIYKIKSIVLNHESLKQLFDYEGNQIQETFSEAITYAYRRNLDKKCNQQKNKVQRFFKKFNSTSTSDEEKFLICHLLLRLIGEKQDLIWDQFVQSLILKKKFNSNLQNQQSLRKFLVQEIPKKTKFLLENTNEALQKRDLEISKEISSGESKLNELIKSFLEFERDQNF